MEHCPSHDWDRYCDEQERSAGLNWLAEVSEKIKQAYPYWKVEIDPDRAFADDEIIIWNDGTRIIQPYDPETLEPDEAAIVVRTLHKQGLSANVFPLSKYDPTKVWAVFIWHPEASWLVIPGTDFTREDAAVDWLKFALSDRSGLNEDHWFAEFRLKEEAQD